MNKTSIEWTHRPETGGAAGGFTWNPIRARLIGASHKARSGTFCTRISPGCTHCYASAINKRFGNGLEYTVPNLEQIEFFVSDKILHEPLHRKAASTIFVGDMFDLFHESIPTEMLDSVFSVIDRAYWHTFQILTKRADRMRTYFFDEFLAKRIEELHPAFMTERAGWCSLPMSHVWLGVSVESQKYADERIPLLLQTPAAVRFLSVEPMLEAVEVHLGESDCDHSCSQTGIDTTPCGPNKVWGCDICRRWQLDWKGCDQSGISWVICGGESGPGSRPFNLAWAESLQAQCKAANTALFMKQLGSRPVATCKDPSLPDVEINYVKGKSSKGGDPSEWPESLRIRKFPSTEKLVTA
jgi:protein gp37